MCNPMSVAGLLAGFALLLAACGAPTLPAPTAAPPIAAPAQATTASAQAATPLAPRASAESVVKVLRIGASTYPDVIDPQKSSLVGEINILQLAYEGLVRLDEKGQIQPGAADKWALAPDGKTATFHLREGLRRSDGTPMGCADFEYALKREVDPFTTGKIYTSLVTEIKGANELLKYGQMTESDKLDRAQVEQLYANYGVRCTGPRTLEVELVAPSSFWQYIASTWVTFPTDRRSVDKDPDKWWTQAANHAGNGPFKFALIEEGKRIILEANPYYWGGRPKLDRIELHYDADTKKLFEAFTRGDLELVAVAPEWLDTIEATPNLKASLLRYPAAKTIALAFNNSRRPFDDRNVRSAFSQAFDRAGWAREIYKNTLHPYTRWIPPGIPGSQSDKSGVPDTDFEAAVKTLVENGYGALGSTPANPKVDCYKLGDLKLTYPASLTNHVRFKFIADNFVRVIGCPVTLDPVEPTMYATLYKDVRTQPQMSVQGWIQDYPHPQNWLSTYWVCGSFSEMYGYCNPNLDRMLREADQTTELEPALEKYMAAEDVLLNDVPAAFSGYGENLFLAAPYLRGPAQYTSSSDGIWPGSYGPILEYDVDLSKTSTTYPKQ